MIPASLGLYQEYISEGLISGGFRMEAKKGLNSKHIVLKLEINKILKLINSNLINKSYL
jgi:hypothetical protein